MQHNESQMAGTMGYLQSMYPIYTLQAMRLTTGITRNCFSYRLQEDAEF